MDKLFWEHIILIYPSRLLSQLVCPTPFPSLSLASPSHPIGSSFQSWVLSQELSLRHPKAPYKPDSRFVSELVRSMWLHHIFFPLTSALLRLLANIFSVSLPSFAFNGPFTSISCSNSHTQAWFILQRASPLVSKTSDSCMVSPISSFFFFFFPLQPSLQVPLSFSVSLFSPPTSISISSPSESSSFHLQLPTSNQ